MDAFDTSLNRRPRAVGLKLGVILLVLLAIGGAWVGAYYFMKSTGNLKRVEHVVGQYDYGWPSWMGKGAKKATYTEPAESNHVATSQLTPAPIMTQKTPAVVTQAKPTPMPATPPKAIKRPPIGFISHERKMVATSEDDLVLAPGTFIQGTLQTTLNSEVEGYFTIKTTRPVFDSVTGQTVVIPQGQSIVAKDTSSVLLVGNERIPTFALTLALPGGREVDLGDAPVMDVTGTNGLTGKVDNHTWRLVWTSIFIEGLRAGQQVIQQSIAQSGDGIHVTGIGQYSGNLAQQRLGRAQDTRPTIIAAAGQVVNVLVTKAIRLPATTVAKR